MGLYKFKFQLFKSRLSLLTVSTISCLTIPKVTEIRSYLVTHHVRLVLHVVDVKSRRILVEQRFSRVRSAAPKFRRVHRGGLMLMVIVVVSVVWLATS